jgi:hypothetical protein
MKRGDIQALVVNDAWDTRLSEKAFNNDKGGNAKIEENRGNHFSKLEMPDASDESDNED